MVFQGKTPTAICEQMKDPKQNGGKNLAQLLEHATHDPIVLWGWAPGKGRTLPPLTHDAFVAAFKAWVDSDGPVRKLRGMTEVTALTEYRPGRRRADQERRARRCRGGLVRLRHWRVRLLVRARARTARVGVHHRHSVRSDRGGSGAGAPLQPDRATGPPRAHRR